MPKSTRRKFLLGLGATLAAPALLRLSLRQLRAQDFGLKADGQTNDLPALRDMLKEIERKGQGTIRLPAGRILLHPEKASALILPANTKLEGAGRDQTTLFMADGAGTGHVINAPFGYVQISALTIDGNEAKRPGVIGHNIRFNGEQVVVEQVRCINSVSYGIAIAQKNYARNVVVRDVEVIGTGADGIDIKNWLRRTEGILIENVTVRNFGRPDPSLPPEMIGTSRDKGGAKAGVDLRGKCEVRNLLVEGVLSHRSGLRFRIGDAGAHGSSASKVTVRGAKGQKRSIGIAALSRDVRLEDIDITDTAIAISSAAPNLQIARGKIEGSSEAAIFTATTPYSKTDKIVLQSVNFKNESRFALKDAETVQFDGCSFSDCRDRIKDTLSQDPHVTLTDCRFDSSCG